MNSCLKCSRQTRSVICVLLILSAQTASGAEPIKTNPPAAANTQPASVTRSEYRQLLKPLDIFAPPSQAKKLLSLKEVYELVVSKGVAIKVARQDLKTTSENMRQSKATLLPKVDLNLGHGQTWTKTRSDSDPSDDYIDREHYSGSRSLRSNAGIVISGAPFAGTSYSLNLPTLGHNHNQPDKDTSIPERDDQGTASASFSLSLLKDNPFLSESAKKRRERLLYTQGREAFRDAALNALQEAEKSYYDLVVRSIRLAIQERSLLMAKALRADVGEMIKAGESNANEALKADLQVAQLETDLLQANIDFENAVETFRANLSLSEEERTGVFPDPAVLKNNLPDVKQELSKAKNNAKKGNSKVSVTKIASMISACDLELARTAALPSLNFTTSYSNSAPADGWDRATNEAFKPNDRSFDVKLELNMPLYNDTSRNSVTLAAVTAQKSEYSYNQALLDLEKSLGSLSKRLDIGMKRNSIAKMSREISERALSDEYEKFRLGESNVRNVIEAQNALNNAQLSEISSQIDLISGLAELRTLSGQLPPDVELIYEK